MSYLPLRTLRGKRMHRWVAGGVVVVATALTLAVAVPSVQRSDEVACAQADAMAYWTEVLYRRADEPAFRYLDDLRNRLCVMIDEGVIGLEDAGALFERERLRLYRALRQRDGDGRSTSPRVLG